MIENKNTLEYPQSIKIFNANEPTRIFTNYFTEVEQIQMISTNKKYSYSFEDTKMNIFCEFKTEELIRNKDFLKFPIVSMITRNFEIFFHKTSNIKIHKIIDFQ